ncbi:diguanylate cyclase (GGDEF)-like protein [Variovorax sp. SG517]|uniref:sensor domain-containing diguanylate cyclase n=1 Tax=Variovorax sp. SG517 TaxID=2587117 RepID=UPI00159E2F1D|nr:GGDEF domain-containing protein [Variovorax sp. SG517]NVM92595.1 diguanylate cyclase (GGDEF)-like protein [Variovorax sp. SG517]
MPPRPRAQRLATLAGHHPMIVGALGTVLTLIVLFISALTLWKDRETAVEHAHGMSRNVAAVLSGNISRTIESADQSLLMLIAALDKPAIRNLDPEVRHELLFGSTLSARYVTGMGVTDDKGRLMDGCCSSTHQWDFGDRDYFTVHRDSPEVGLYVSKAYRARSRGGVEAIALSRRINRADGAFAGTALVAIDLEYFSQLLDKLDIGPHGVASIVRTDGTLVARTPAMVDYSFKESPTFPRMLDRESGFYAAPSAIDGTLRLYTFQRVPGTPFIAVVAPAMDDALAPWKKLSWMVGLSSLLVGSAFCGGVWLLAFALRGRVMAEEHLRELTQTDSLTGLKNRRALDAALENEWDRLQRSGSCLSVLFVDADNFKRYNDEYGHAQGDVALQHLAACIASHVRRRGDLAARYGGEEFVVVLPDTDESGAMQVAEAIRAEAEGTRLRSGTQDLPPVTVSIGCTTVRRSNHTSLEALTKAADVALYRAKASGRNGIVWMAVEPAPRP